MLSCLLFYLYWAITVVVYFLATKFSCLLYLSLRNELEEETSQLRKSALKLVALNLAVICAQYTCYDQDLQLLSMALHFIWLSLIQMHFNSDFFIVEINGLPGASKVPGA